MVEQNFTERSAQRTNTYLAPLVLGLFAAPVLLMLAVGRGVSPSIAEGHDSMTVSAHGFDRTIPYSAVDSVELRSTLDGLGNKIRGVNGGNVNVGRFRMQPYGVAMLFVDTRKRPYVVVHARDGVTVISAPDSIEAVALARRIRERSQAASRAPEVTPVSSKDRP